MQNLSINGFGRIGRSVLRAYIENYNKYKNVFKISVLNVGSLSFDAAAHLLKYDSINGRLDAQISVSGDVLKVDAHEFKLVSEMDPLKINWAQYAVSLVLECTGAFTKKSLASKHIEAGAKRVLVSAPCDEADSTIVYGVNHDVLDVAHSVISLGSCTTNCLAPVAYTLEKEIGIESGFMTTVHAFTNDQVLLDTSHKDMRRARAATLSIIPTSTGAAKAIGLVIPSLKGKLDGGAVRVPVPNVSYLELTFMAKRNTTKDEVNQLIKSAVSKFPENVFAYSDEELVSIDFLHAMHSSIFDSTQTKVMGNMCKVVAWYDNEWGFSNRMLDVAALITNL